MEIYLGDLDGLEGLLDISKIMNYTRVLRGEKCNLLSIPEIITRLAGELKIGCIEIIYMIHASYLIRVLIVFTVRLNYLT